MGDNAYEYQRAEDGSVYNLMIASHEGTPSGVLYDRSTRQRIPHAFAVDTATGHYWYRLTGPDGKGVLDPNDPTHLLAARGRGPVTLVPFDSALEPLDFG